jgi:hypothetical protein
MTRQLRRQILREVRAVRLRCGKFVPYPVCYMQHGAKTGEHGTGKFDGKLAVVTPPIRENCEMESTA